MNQGGRREGKRNNPSNRVFCTEQYGPDTRDPLCGMISAARVKVTVESKGFGGGNQEGKDRGVLSYHGVGDGDCPRKPGRMEKSAQ